MILWSRVEFRLFYFPSRLRRSNWHGCLLSIINIWPAAQFPLDSVPPDAVTLNLFTVLPSPIPPHPTILYSMLQPIYKFVFEQGSNACIVDTVLWEVWSGEFSQCLKITNAKNATFCLWKMLLSFWLKLLKNLPVSESWATRAQVLAVPCSLPYFVT